MEHSITQNNRRKSERNEDKKKKNIRNKVHEINMRQRITSLLFQGELVNGILCILYSYSSFFSLFFSFRCCKVHSDDTMTAKYSGCVCFFFIFIAQAIWIGWLGKFSFGFDRVVWFFDLFFFAVAEVFGWFVRPRFDKIWLLLYASFFNLSSILRWPTDLSVSEYLTFWWIFDVCVCLLLYTEAMEDSPAIPAQS